MPGPEGGIQHRHGSSSAVPVTADQVVGERVSLSLLGDGYIEAIDDRDLQQNAAEQRRADLGIAGAAVSAPVLESNPPQTKLELEPSAGGPSTVRQSAIGNRKPTMQAGRFGWKSQHSSLLSACAESLRNELGIRNRLYSDEYPTHNTSGGTAPPTPFDKPDPADAGPGKTELERVVEEVRHTAPPARDEQLAASMDAQSGEKLFARTGCALCLVTTYKTLPPGTPINSGTYRIPDFIGNTVIHPYSDFLLHDVGTGDGIPQAAEPEYFDQSTADIFRTAPLWGLRFRSWMTHDGKSVTYHQAIMRHGGEASKVREQYEALTPVEKQQVHAFLNSL